MESLVATLDPVLQAAAHIAGFAEAMVQDTPTGKVVLVRHRFEREWAPFHHLEPGACALDAFYGTAFWERADVVAMYQRQEDAKEASHLAVQADISKDFRRELGRKVRAAVDGRDDLMHALARLGRVRV